MKWVLRLMLVVMACGVFSTAYAQVVYTYTGAPFTTVSPPYSLGDQITGSMTLSGSLSPFMPYTDITSLITDFSFTDGNQTRTFANSVICRASVATDGIGRPSRWSIALRETPLPALGDPYVVMDLSTNIDQVGEAPAPAIPCDDNLSLPIVSFSSTGGTWSSTAFLPPQPSTYTFTGAPFTQADPPYALGGQVLGSIQVSRPLPPFMPPTNLWDSLDALSFADGVQTLTPANSAPCEFLIGTDGSGNIIFWSIFLFDFNINPGDDEPFIILSSNSNVDQAGELPGGTGCIGGVPSLLAMTSRAGSWGNPGLPPVQSWAYNYTGAPLSQIQGAYPATSVTGSILLPGPLPPSMPLTDIAYALANMSFADGVQTRSLGDTEICEFQVATDANGDIVDWSVLLRETFPGAANLQQALESFGPSSSSMDRVGSGAAGGFGCDTISLTNLAENSVPGTWRTLGPANRPIPSLTLPGILLMGIVLFWVAYRRRFAIK